MRDALRRKEVDECSVEEKELKIERTNSKRRRKELFDLGPPMLQPLGLEVAEGLIKG